ncbi:hypothetical protein [Pseudoduganella sp. R-34]
MFTVDDLAVTRVGDQCSCTLLGHRACVILESVSEQSIRGDSRGI